MTTVSRAADVAAPPAQLVAPWHEPVLAPTPLPPAGPAEAPRARAARPRRTGLRSGPWLVALLSVGDALGLVAGLVLAPVLAPVLTTGPAAGLPGPAGVVLVVLGLLLLGNLGRLDLPVTGGGEARRLLSSGALLAVATTGLAVLAGVDLRPAELLVLVGVPTVSALVWRTAAARILRTRIGAVRVVVAGHRSAVAGLLGELDRSVQPRFRVEAVCVPRAGGGRFAVPQVSGFARIPEMVREHGADAVIVVPCRHFDAASLRRLRWQLEDGGTALLLASGLGDVGTARTAFRYAGELPLVQVRHAELRGARRGFKSAVDRVLALAALVVLAPLLVCLAVAIRLDSPGPAIFRQVRVGRDGVPFSMLKLRTMTDDAEERRRDLVALADPDVVLFKMRADPRVTRIGAVLRRYSLDELLQLVNVVRGEMSLVGPRPALPDEVARYAEDVRRRLAVRPGITGLWQVSGRSDLTWADTVRLDLRYVDNWSLAGDLRILLRTVGVVVRHRGAY